MSETKPRILKGIARVDGSVEGEALVSSDKISHAANAVDKSGVILTYGHCLEGQSYAGKILVYPTDIFSTTGALGLYFVTKHANCGPKALVCQTVHPISIGGAIDAEIPAVDSFDADPCTVIKTGDWIKISAPEAGGEAIIEIYPKNSSPSVKDAGQEAEVKKSKGVQKWKKSDLVLTPYEREMLNGKHGKGKQVAMERLVQFGQGVGAKRMAKLRSAHVFGDHKSEFMTAGAWPLFEEFVAMDAKVAIPTTFQCTFIAEELIDDPGMPWNFKPLLPARDVYNGVKVVNDMAKTLGMTMIPTCIPYMHLSVPRIGEVHAWMESNAAAFANVMVGARVNRDPANMVFYAAFTGVTPEYGLLLDENRRGQVIFEIDPALASELTDEADFVALGGAIGFKAVEKVPVVIGLSDMTNAQAKAFIACVSPAMTYPMIHVVGVTPEAQTLEDAFGGRVPKDVERIRISKSDIANVYQGIHNTDRLDIDGACIGCPFLLYDELVKLADMLAGKKVQKPLWLYTDYIIYSAAQKSGVLAAIESSGARVVHSICPGLTVRNPSDASNMVFVTDSLKTVKLMGGPFWPKWWLGTREDTVNAAITGKFTRTRWK